MIMMIMMMNAIEKGTTTKFAAVAQSKNSVISQHKGQLETLTLQEKKCN